MMYVPLYVDNERQFIENVKAYTIQEYYRGIVIFLPQLQYNAKYFFVNL